MGCCFSQAKVEFEDEENRHIQKRDSGSPRAPDDIELGQSPQQGTLKKRNNASPDVDVSKGIESTNAWGSIAEPAASAAKPALVNQPILVDRRAEVVEKKPVVVEAAPVQEKKPVVIEPVVKPVLEQVSKPAVVVENKAVDEAQSRKVSEISKRAQQFERKPFSDEVQAPAAAAPRKVSEIAKRAKEFEKQEAEAAAASAVRTERQESVKKIVPPVIEAPAPVVEPKVIETPVAKTEEPAPKKVSEIAKRAESFQKFEPKPVAAKPASEPSSATVTNDEKPSDQPEAAARPPVSGGKSSKISALQEKMAGIPLGGGFGKPLPGMGKLPAGAKALPGMGGAQTLPSRKSNAPASEEVSSSEVTPSTSNNSSHAVTGASGELLHYTMSRPIIKAERRRLTSIHWKADENKE
jgi:hypothetical protein